MHTKKALSNITPHRLQKTYEVINAIASAVENSYGPYGAYTNTTHNGSTKDGDVIAKSIMFDVQISVKIKEILIQASSDIGSREPGDGTTSLLLLIKNMIKHILKDDNFDKLFNTTRVTVQDVIRMFNEVGQEIVDAVEHGFDIKLSAKNILNTFKVSLNNDDTLVEPLREAMKVLGIDTESDEELTDAEKTKLHNIVFKSKKELSSTVVETGEGFKLVSAPKGMTVGDLATGKTINNAIIIPIDTPLNSTKAITTLVAFLERVLREGISKDIVLLVRPIDDVTFTVFRSIKQKLVSHEFCDSLNLLEYEAPQSKDGSVKKKDTDVYLGNVIVRLYDPVEIGDVDLQGVGSEATQDLFIKHMKLADLKFTNDGTVIVRDNSDNTALVNLIGDLKATLKDLEEKKSMEDELVTSIRIRLNRLIGGTLVIINLGASTNSMKTRLVTMYQDGMLALYAALKHGIVPGMGVAIPKMMVKTLSIEDLTSNPLKVAVYDIIHDSYEDIIHLLCDSTKDPLVRSKVTSFMDDETKINQTYNLLTGEVGNSVYNTLLGELVVLSKCISVVTNLISWNQISHIDLSEATQYCHDMTADTKILGNI